MDIQTSRRMAHNNLDLPEEILTKLAELDLELSEGKPQDTGRSGYLF